MANKKDRKRLQVLNQRAQKLQGDLTALKTQVDDPEELATLVAELAKVREEITKLKER